MQLRDYIAIAALLISLGSLCVALRVAGFSRRVKLAELRATLLAKVSEATSLQSKVRTAQAEFLDAAYLHNDQDMYSSLDTTDLEMIDKTISEMYEHLSQTSIANSAAVYESHFHHVTQICDRLRTIGERTKATKDRYVLLKRDKRP